MNERTEDVFFQPDVDARLRMRERDKVFAIGSCFARNVEAFLVPRFQVPSFVPKSEVPPDIAAMHPDLTADLTLWHRYNVFSIRNSLVWALTPDDVGARARLLQVAPGRSVDPYAGSRTILETSNAERLRGWIDATMAGVRACRVVIITLGLSEVWEDRQTGLVMNAAPLTEMWTAFPDRFRFRVATCQETLGALQEVHEVLSRHCAEGVQIVVTVSPVPLLATFRTLDIVVANAASKAILRAAVDQWSTEHENVHYFPSYEMILNSRQTDVWLDDFRHCRIDVIRRVMDVFLTQFVTLDG